MDCPKCGRESKEAYRHSTATKDERKYRYPNCNHVEEVK